MIEGHDGLVVLLDVGGEVVLIGAGAVRRANDDFRRAQFVVDLIEMFQYEVVVRRGRLGVGLRWYRRRRGGRGCRRDGRSRRGGRRRSRRVSLSRSGERHGEGACKQRRHQLGHVSVLILVG